MFGSQWGGWVSMRDTQSPTPPTVGDALEEGCLLVTGNDSRSNMNKPLGDNSAQQSLSTPNRKGLKAEASGTKSDELGAEALRI